MKGIYAPPLSLPSPSRASCLLAPTSDFPSWMHIKANCERQRQNDDVWGRRIAVVWTGRDPDFLLLLVHFLVLAWNLHKLQRNKALANRAACYPGCRLWKELSEHQSLPSPQLWDYLSHWETEKASWNLQQYQVPKC